MEVIIEEITPPQAVAPKFLDDKKELLAKKNVSLKSKTAQFFKKRSQHSNSIQVPVQMSYCEILQATNEVSMASTILQPDRSSVVSLQINPKMSANTGQPPKGSSNHYYYSRLQGESQPRS